MGNACSKRTKKIEELARSLIARTERVITQTTVALKSLSKTQIAPCSREHIIRMRKAIFQTDSIDKVIYLKDGNVKCSSWEAIDQYAGRYSADFVTSDRVEISIKIKPRFGGKDHAMLLKYGAYGAFVNASRFVDLIVEEDVQTFIALLLLPPQPPWTIFFGNLS
ncbi:CSS-motif domain-containing protein [Pseudomonas aeruginosa]|uniref:CSS-motif domain-containing protein n=1 Tax=Pseudomonas aeruginosa TaxID=287 RepID=UPI000FC41271|nr:hypothetical protein IPC443_31290 [Pseudomonas aeruginosa]